MEDAGGVGPASSSSAPTVILDSSSASAHLRAGLSSDIRREAVLAGREANELWDQYRMWNSEEVSNS